MIVLIQFLIPKAVTQQGRKDPYFLSVFLLIRPNIMQTKLLMGNIIFPFSTYANIIICFDHTSSCLTQWNRFFCTSLPWNGEYSHTFPKIHSFYVHATYIIRTYNSFIRLSLQVLWYKLHVSVHSVTRSFYSMNTKHPVLHLLICLILNQLQNLLQLLYGMDTEP